MSERNKIKKLTYRLLIEFSSLFPFSILELEAIFIFIFWQSARSSSI
jgi:hypothetical protein